MNIKERSLVIFDGYCNLCTRSVLFIIKRDPEKQFIFVPFQSEKATSIRKKFSLDKIAERTVIFIENDKVYKESAAALRIIEKLKFPWNIFRILNIIPGFVRDPVYRMIARNRIRWFGRRESCYFPDVDISDRFL